MAIYSFIYPPNIVTEDCCDTLPAQFCLPVLGPRGAKWKRKGASGLGMWAEELHLCQCRDDDEEKSRGKNRYESIRLASLYFVRSSCPILLQWWLEQWEWEPQPLGSLSRYSHRRAGRLCTNWFSLSLNFLAGKMKVLDQVMSVSGSFWTHCFALNLSWPC